MIRRDLSSIVDISLEQGTDTGRHGIEYPMNSG